MSRIVDLSLDIYDKAPTFWADPKTAVIEHLHIENLKYNITQLVMSTHLGTHLDAPFHFFDNGRTVDQAGSLPRLRSRVCPGSQRQGTEGRDHA